MTQVNKIYYSVCPDNDNYYRTIRLHKNPFTGNLQSQVSNPVVGGNIIVSNNKANHKQILKLLKPLAE